MAKDVVLVRLTQKLPLFSNNRGQVCGYEPAVAAQIVARGMGYYSDAEGNRIDSRPGLRNPVQVSEGDDSDTSEDDDILEDDDSTI